MFSFALLVIKTMTEKYARQSCLYSITEAAGFSINNFLTIEKITERRRKETEKNQARIKRNKFFLRRRKRKAKKYCWSENDAGMRNVSTRSKF